MLSHISKEQIQLDYFSNLPEKTRISINNNEGLGFDIRTNGNALNIEFENSNSDLVDILDRAGFFELDMEYLSPTSGDGRPAINKKKSPKENYVNWLKEAIRLSGPGFGYIVPDTNILYRCYYSNFLRNKVLEGRGSLNHRPVLIPRLLVMEVENKYNRASDPKKSKEKRIAFSSMAELQKIISDGGLFSSKIDYSLLREFTNIAGRGFADSWIRMEISQYHIHHSEATSNFPSHTYFTPIVFLTCDLMNALAGTAEGLNCVYFHRSSNLINTNLDIASIVYHTAIQFGECSFSKSTTSESKMFVVKGIWDGKTPDDWKNDLIVIEEI